MKLILRGDLRCPHRNCQASVVEYRDSHLRDRMADYRCRVHGSIRPALRGAAPVCRPANPTGEHIYPRAAPCRNESPPPDDEPAPYRVTLSPEPAKRADADPPVPHPHRRSPR